MESLDLFPGDSMFATCCTCHTCQGTLELGLSISDVVREQIRLYINPGHVSTPCFFRTWVQRLTPWSIAWIDKITGNIGINRAGGKWLLGFKFVIPSPTFYQHFLGECFLLWGKRRRSLKIGKMIVLIHKCVWISWIEHFIMCSSLCCGLKMTRRNKKVLRKAYKVFICKIDIYLAPVMNYSV